MKKLVLAAALCLVGQAAFASPILPVMPVAPRPSIVMPIVAVQQSAIASYRQLRSFWISRAVIR